MKTNPSKRIVDCRLHQLTGPQILYALMCQWREGRESVIVATDPGTSGSIMNRVRIALTRERKARGEGRAFALKHGSEVIGRDSTGAALAYFVIEKSKGGAKTAMARAIRKTYIEFSQRKANKESNHAE